MTANKAIEGKKGFPQSMYVDKKMVSLRLSSECREILDGVARLHQISVTEAIERIVRGDIVMTDTPVVEKRELREVIAGDEQLMAAYQANAQVRDLMRRLWRYA